MCDLVLKYFILYRCEQYPGKLALENFMSQVYGDVDTEQTIEF